VWAQAQFTAGDPAPAPQLRDLRATRIEATWAAVRWAGPEGSYEVSYRPVRWPRHAWMTADNVRGFSQSLVALEPDTTYEVRVRLQWPPHYDEQGQVVAAPVPPDEPARLRLTTAAWRPRTVGMLRIWPMKPMYTMGGPASHPRLVAARDHLYLAQQYQGGIYLSKLPPATLVAEWTRELVPPAPTGAPPLALEDLAVLGETLSVLYRRGPNELVLQGFRLDTEQAEAPLVVSLAEPPARLAHAALAAYHGDLWVLTLEENDTSRRRGLLRLGLVSGGRVSETYAWRDAPVLDPAEASLAPFGDELMIPFSDVLAEGAAAGRQPLRLVSFDGLRFSGLRRMRDEGRNREPQGVQLGSSFYLAYTSDAAYAGYRGRYRDLLLSILAPDRLGLAAITLLDDEQCNLSPDIAALGSSLWTVHEKLEHAPENASDQPRSYGVFIGRIDFGEAPRE